MAGFVYRLGMRIKDFGERIKSGSIQRLGLKIRDSALRMKAR